MIDRLREALVVGEGTLPPGEMPDPETLFDAVVGGLSPSDVAHLADLAARSPELAEEWRVARAIEAQARVVPFRPRRWAPLPLLAAAAILMIGFIAVIWYQHQPPAPIYRGAEEEQLASLLPEGKALPRDRFLLRWTSAGDGARYSLRLTDADLRPLFKARDLARPETKVPEESLESVPDGDQVLWQVEASTANGERHVSATYVQRVGPSGSP
jgi:hypothetical protein